MALIKSISGIRGTIGGKPNEGFSPIDIVKFTAAYGQIITGGKLKGKIVVGRDARISGDMVKGLVINTLVGLGIDVVDLDLTTTPTVEMAVPMENADGGIILTASHNPKQWNALKLLNSEGEFISGELGEEVLRIADLEDITFCEVDHLGTVTQDDSYLQKHTDAILALDMVDVEAIQEANLKVVCDCVNSTGGIYVPYLLEKLGVEVVELYCDPTGEFPHNPEPLPAHLTEISSVIVRENAHVGVVVDPDVDRLAMVCEDGSMFGEEYTLVAVSDYVLKHRQGDTVSNMSSTRALRDVTESNGFKHHASAVGEVNVVKMMKEVNAVIGGEGNGGIILPELHYGRDALVGIALFLTHLAKSSMTASALRASYPEYVISKNKMDLTPDLNVDELLVNVKEKFAGNPINDVDGVKIEFGQEWVHLRKSNTEPIIRIYSESKTQESADALAQKMISEINSLI